MYTKMAARKGWKTDLVEVIGLTGVGMGTTDAYREAILEVKGEGAFGILKREAGVHRVQRVPATDSQGRVHTSTVGIIVSCVSPGMVSAVKNDSLNLYPIRFCHHPMRRKCPRRKSCSSRRMSKSKLCALEELVDRYDDPVEHNQIDDANADSKLLQ